MSIFDGYPVKEAANPYLHPLETMASPAISPVPTDTDISCVSTIDFIHIATCCSGKDSRIFGDLIIVLYYVSFQTMFNTVNCMDERVYVENLTRTKSLQI